MLKACAQRNSTNVTARVPFELRSVTFRPAMAPVVEFVTGTTSIALRSILRSIPGLNNLSVWVSWETSGIAVLSVPGAESVAKVGTNKLVLATESDSKGSSETDATSVENTAITTEGNSRGVVLAVIAPSPVTTVSVLVTEVSVTEVSELLGEEDAEVSRVAGALVDTKVRMEFWNVVVVITVGTSSVGDASDEEEVPIVRVVVDLENSPVINGGSTVTTIVESVG
ncbi:hypothetical protein FS842_009440 [Serendipita sp. 407]|nr:hypothetical protein FS842_009440 [Serendipita sp. 407]